MTAYRRGKGEAAEKYLTDERDRCLKALRRQKNRGAGTNIPGTGPPTAALETAMVCVALLSSGPIMAGKKPQQNLLLNTFMQQ